MKYFKRLGIYKASNVTFDPNTMQAYSHGWWRFTMKLGGIVVFNNYRYSQSTCMHQAKVRQLLESSCVDFIEVDLGSESLRSVTVEQVKAAIDAEIKELEAKAQRARKNKDLLLELAERRRKELIRLVA